MEENLKTECGLCGVSRRQEVGYFNDGMRELLVVQKTGCNM